MDEEYGLERSVKGMILGMWWAYTVLFVWCNAMVCPSVSGLGDDGPYKSEIVLLMLYGARVIFSVLLPVAIMTAEYTGCTLNISALKC